MANLNVATHTSCCHLCARASLRGDSTRTGRDPQKSHIERAAAASALCNKRIELRFSLRCRTQCSARRQSARTRAASASAAPPPPLSCPHPSQPQRGAAPGHQLQGGSQQSRTHVSQLHTRTDKMSRSAGGRHISRFASGASPQAKAAGAHRAGWAAGTYQQKQRTAAAGFRADSEIHAADAACACADAALLCCTIVPGASSHDRASLCIHPPNCVMREPQAAATGFCLAAAAGATRMQH